MTAWASGARRLTARPWPACARRALRAVGLWLAALACGVAMAEAGEVVSGEVVSARLSAPTGRYPHGVLGDRIEHGALELELRGGVTRRFVLPQDLVFEDVAPRLVDLDGDGAPEVIVVESSLTLGSRLALWGAEGRITATPHIGQPYRWLAPVGAADLDGDGAVELAYVDRPHLAKVLRILRYRDGVLREVAAAPDVSNHQIGWRRIAGGIRTCPGAPPQIIVSDGGWQDVLALELSGAGAVTRQVLGRYDGPESLTEALACH